MCEDFVCLVFPSSYVWYLMVRVTWVQNPRICQYVVQSPQYHPLEGLLRRPLVPAVTIFLQAWEKTLRKRSLSAAKLRTYFAPGESSHVSKLQELLPLEKSKYEINVCSTLYGFPHIKVCSRLVSGDVLEECHVWVQHQVDLLFAVFNLHAVPLKPCLSE